ncbi:MAG: translation elongation factor 4 [Candidatus Aminicenantes bacterium]|nr:translation elongation factor 4 [Candidatus Aminicenantes bacterium]
MDNIRNFSIIAHIDHGKSTLADRLLEKTGALTAKEQREQVLDTMELERERGITIKAQTARLHYQDRDGRSYILNLIDTPGHVDFAYEVSRSLAACEGALLVVDASQGVEAQTLANTYLALQYNLTLIPVINKIDLPQADPQQTREQIDRIIGIPGEEGIEASAKTGQGIDTILEEIIRRIPPPKGDRLAPLKALLLDSWFDSYRGVIILVRVFDGRLVPGQKIALMSSGFHSTVEEVGYLTPKPLRVEAIDTGEVGYVIAGIKEMSRARVGDTLTDARNRASASLPGFQPAKPMVFCGMYPTGASSVDELRRSLEKLQLTDFSFIYEAENSPALGMGFRCGFLGLLHREIIQERLEREFDLNLITTAPNVNYRVTQKDGSVTDIHSPAQLPDSTAVGSIAEPVIEALIITPERYLGPILKLLERRRGRQKKMEYISPQRIILTYHLPLNEIVLDFYSALKSVSQGYASMDYEFLGYVEADLVKLEILINQEPVDALSLILHRDKAFTKGRAFVEKLKEVIPRQQVAISLQAAIGKRIIARETVKSFRKDVTAKLYGGDYTRKMKLLEKQKAGKLRMKKIGQVEIPQEAFLSVLDIN